MDKDNIAKMIWLTGAPLSKSLDWTEESLCCPLQHCFQDHKGTESPVAPTSAARPAWRMLPLETMHLPSGLTQLIETGEAAEWETQGLNEETSFLTMTDVSMLSDLSEELSSQAVQSSGSNPDDTLTQFYEYSYALHEEQPTADVICLDSNNDMTQFSLAAFAGGTKMAETAEQLPQEVAQAKPRSLNTTSLRNIPNASVIRALGTSTMSVDLVVGVLAISQPRSIKTRKYGRLVELVEITVADDTKAGFGITIWLPVSKERSSKTAQEDRLRSSVATLRPQDIILARNVALESFKGKVYGQSLRKGITKLDLLYRNLVDAQDEPGAYSWDELNAVHDDPQLVRVKMVHDWVMSFVGAGHRPPGGETKRTNGTAKQSRPQLPADTQ